ncbi:hypothetical protein QYE76_051258 [Lolium multiflorum]|uniref:RING-type domain-containing protein n=1 Tax=Lolium multiflorum TaxID=4521 RepID=A0AAD8WI06_LOLMU|nr:hypothetical protein QYE76_051258 [Lolium multiflorum]
MKNSSMINGSVDDGGGNDDDPLPIPSPIPFLPPLQDVEAIAMDKVYERRRERAEPIDTRDGRASSISAAVDGLPTVVVADAQCAVCKDGIEAGEAARRLPCAHLYHGACILPWLAIRNTCPLCRHELPTDDAEYETWRARRAAAGGGDDDRYYFVGFCRGVIVLAQKNPPHNVLAQKYPPHKIRLLKSVDVIKSPTMVFVTAHYPSEIGWVDESTPTNIDEHWGEETFSIKNHCLHVALQSLNGSSCTGEADGDSSFVLLVTVALWAYLIGVPCGHSEPLSPNNIGSNAFFVNYTWCISVDTSVPDFDPS